MTHFWGDSDFDWKGLHDAGTFIQEFVMTKSGHYLSWKEKYGTIRYESTHKRYLGYRPMWFQRLGKYLARKALKKAIFIAIESTPSPRTTIF